MRTKPKNDKHIIGFLFVICLLLTTFLGTLLFTLKSLNIPDLRSVANYTPMEASVIYDRNGKVVERVFAQNRSVIGLEKMNRFVPQAFVAAEDGRFYDHPGLDFISVLRAALNNLREGRRGQGGSTITQQVAKSLLLTPEKTYIRKFKEAILAWRIDTLLTKDEILFIYLNQIYLGEGAYGVEAASQVYFGKSAADLTLAEVALLAGLPQAPSKYSPMKHLERAVARQRYVLNRMAADGYISSKQARTAYNDKPRVKKRRQTSRPINGYYLSAVKKQVEEIVGKPLQQAGLEIYTNLDQHLQEVAAKSLVKGVKAVYARQIASGARGGASAPQAALVGMERKSGKVRALVGGSDFLKSPFNRAVQAKRPAGSTFKPFVYATAFEHGWKPDSIISDAPLAIDGGKGGTWRPKNYTGKYHGDTSLSTALVMSYNVATVRLAQKVGVKKVEKIVRDSGISAPIPPDLSMALGAVDVSLLEMTASYSIFCDDGNYTRPSLIRKVVHRGEVVYEAGRERHRVLTSDTARDMKVLLERVVSGGTGKRARGLAGRPGGKTGTSDDNRDAWFVGFNNRYITGVWVGHDRNQSLGRNENGGRTAVPIWKDFMGRVEGR